MKKILIVEDDTLIADLERDYLEASEYEVDVAKDGIEGIRLFRENEYDLALLDIMLPGMSGFDICREIRKETLTPVIMVTAKKTDIDKIRGLGLGADDYIVKPFSPAELVARVKAHIQMHETLLSQAQPKKEEVIEFRDLQILPLSHKVFVKEKEISMTNKEYELLLFMATNPNIVFSKETLFDRIWGMDAVGDMATVTVHVNRIREKIEVDTSNPEYLVTVWGAGYRFNII
ncbi:MAG: response regulator transcription factor [Hespellia sp.]|nr:response regulator transcription factor [Hespellia sp.]